MDPQPSIFEVIDESKRLIITLRDHDLDSLPPSKISDSSKTTLHRLLSAELRFLSRLQSQSQQPPPPPPPPLSLNLGYLRSIIRIIHHPSVHRISRLCKPLRTSPSVHVDIVCTFGKSPAWFLVSDRSPAFLSRTGYFRCGLGVRVRRVLTAARSAGALKPSSIFLSFSRGVDDEVAAHLSAEFGAAEVDLFPSEKRAFLIELPGEDDAVGAGVSECFGGRDGAVVGSGVRDEFVSVVSAMDPEAAGDVINFDTTALVALVSGISNGGGERLLKAQEAETRIRFKGNYDFVLAQVMSELEHPILSEMGASIAGKKGIVCESVYSEFMEIVKTCGGPNEKSRADHLIKHLLVVKDSPSERIASLLTTRKVAMKNKITFGTGDYWQAPTLTANMGFVRAISQIGMSLLTIEHRPCALIGH